MTPLPPSRASGSPRRSGAGRAGLLSILGILLTGCGPATPSPTPTPSRDTGSVTALPGPDGADGLVVAVGGRLLGSDVAGVLSPLELPGAPVIALTTGGGRIVILDRVGQGWLGSTTGPDASTWRELAIPAAAGPDPPPIGLSPSGDRLAAAIGMPQGRTFALRLIDVPGGGDRSISVERGLNGAPVWLGPGIVALNVIRQDQRSGFVSVDVAGGTVADLPSFGFSLSATSDGNVVAFDDSASGDVLVGARSDINAAGFERMTRVPSPPGTSPDAVALSPDGARLAIVRRTESEVTIEILARSTGQPAWIVLARPAIPGDPAISIAWLR